MTGASTSFGDSTWGNLYVVLEEVQFRSADQVRTFPLSLAPYPAGVYYLVLRTANGWVTEKIIRH